LALDEFLVIKVEDPTLVILASKLKGEISSSLAQISNNPYERKSKNQISRVLNCSILDPYPWIASIKYSS
jgi:hypothetical protein